jgi:hypothetical protein
MYLVGRRSLHHSLQPSLRVQSRVLHPPRLSEGCSEVNELKTLLSRHAPVETTGLTPDSSGSDEASIYRAVLDSWLSDKRGILNVSATTFPLPDDLPSGLVTCDCLERIHLVDAAAFHSRHTLNSAILHQVNVRLVDPEKQASSVRNNDPDIRIRRRESVKQAVDHAFESGLFSLSEIAFDKNRRYAVVAYRFWCGSLCGSGSTLVFEKIDGKWREDRSCGGWVS